MNRQLERHLRRLRLDPATPPSLEQWQAFVARMDASYDDRDRERYLSDRSTRLASAELSAATLRAERKSAELRTVIDALVEGIFLIDADGVVRSINPSARELVGRDPTGETVRTAFAGIEDQHGAEDGVSLVARLVAAVFEGRELGVEHALLERGADLRHLAIRVCPIPEQRITVVAINDVTVTVEAEATRIGLERRIGQQHRLESIGRLAGSVAHDFNNVLAGILTCVELLEDDVEGESLDDVNEIRRSARRGADLTRRLLAFSRHESDEPGLTDVSAVVTDLSTLLFRMLADHATLTIDLAPDRCDVLIDPIDLEQIVMNLVVNARDAVDEAGAVTIQTRLCSLDEDAARQLLVSEGNYVMLGVSDNGVGMDTNTIARAIEPFFTTKAHGEGNGLGLATVHGLVANGGGALAIESEPNIGTAVCLYLPMAVAHATGSAGTADADAADEACRSERTRA